MGSLKSKSTNLSLPKILDQAIEIAGPKTLTGKELRKSKQAYLQGDDEAIRRTLYKAFDKLPKNHTEIPLTPKEQQLIEAQLAKLFQTSIAINCPTDQQALKRIDELADKSYDHLQTGGSIVSLRYLLEALDLAQIPISKSTLKSFYKPLQVKSKSKSKSKQVGGDITVPLIIGGSSLGLLIISLIIYFTRSRRPTSPLQGAPGTDTSGMRGAVRPFGRNVDLLYAPAQIKQPALFQPQSEALPDVPIRPSAQSLPMGYQSESSPAPASTSSWLASTSYASTPGVPTASDIYKTLKFSPRTVSNIQGGINYLAGAKQILDNQRMVSTYAQRPQPNPAYGAMI